HPSPATIALIQDKLLQKQHLSGVAGVSLGEYCDVPDVAALVAAGQRWGYPIMLKARKLAYDGRGNLPVNAASEAASAFATLSVIGAVRGLVISQTLSLAELHARWSAAFKATVALSARVLAVLEQRTGQPVSALFHLIVGEGAGAALALLIGLAQPKPDQRLPRPVSAEAAAPVLADGLH
ncbi:MAG: ATP-grasp domain-containing protein, partial [Pseudomonadota bacterium]|nr:ATP-grasp domain-containing protein [Pseudomonadota bacterium]MEC8585869.1 ATP-grasp domain-containing protein [Pseudomonadota bacterium]